MLSLDVAISTYREEGIKRVEKMLSSPKTGVKYIISWQEHENAEIPISVKERKDVEVFRLDKKGLSNNRNNAIDHCKGDIILISDDDLQYQGDFADKIIYAFEKNPEVDLGIFKVKFEKEKAYPEEDCQLNLPFPKNYYCSSVEIAFRREKVSALKFWDKMGLGNHLLECGEDELFLISAIKRSLNCRFFNEYIATHPLETTGNKISDGILRGQGFIIGLIYPYTSIFRIPLKAFRTYKTKKIAFFSTLLQLERGAFKSIFHWKKIPENSRW